MPELPEVETIKNEIEPYIKNKAVREVVVSDARVIKTPRKDFIEGIKGSTIKEVIRKGKLLIINLSCGKSLTVHLKMTGQLIYPGELKQSKVSFLLSDGKYLSYNDRRLLGELRLVEDWKELKFIKELGPEPFDITPKQFSDMLKDKKTKIKPLIMDQKFMAGVGNLYACEALFRAGISPSKTASSLNGRESALLLKEIVQTLREAIKSKGSSMDQYLRPSGEKGNYVAFHKVYDREGKPCLACANPIKRIALGGRGTYFCPRCQE